MLGVLALALVLGLLGQRLPDAAAWRDRTWFAFYWLLTPALVFVTFLTLKVDGRLLLALAAAVLATWTLFLAGAAYARLVAGARDTRGALMLAVGWPNTGFVGFPVAQLLFGAHGVALAVVYDRLSWLVPGTSASATVARSYGRRGGERGERVVRAALLNPPLLAMAAGLAARGAHLHLAGVIEVRTWLAYAVGPTGFLLLGVSLPLQRVAHDVQDVGRAAGALVLRFAGGPLVLLAYAHLLHAAVPGVFYLLAAMPPAFHLLVLARVYDVRPALTRLLVIGATVPAVVVAVVAAAIAR